MHPLITLKLVTLAEASTLLDISRATFFDAFAPLNTPEAMEAYAARSFTREKLREELGNPDSEFYFAYLMDHIVGYIKLNFGRAQTEFGTDNMLEIERIYVLQQHQGKKIGEQLLNFATEQATERKLNAIWLGVWEYNIKAIRFYQRYGFEAFSTHKFMLGDEQQTDILMKRVLVGGE